LAILGAFKLKCVALYYCNGLVWTTGKLAAAIFDYGFLTCFAKFQKDIFELILLQIKHYAKNLKKKILKCG
jgi:hypothetical protein